MPPMNVYGAPRITRELAVKGVVVARKTVAASMRRQGLEGISPSMFTPVTTIQDPAATGFADHAQRQWDQGRLDAVWTSDITYLPTGEGGSTSRRSVTGTPGACWGGPWTSARTPVSLTGRCA